MRVLGITIVLIVFGFGMFILLKRFNDTDYDLTGDKEKEELERKKALPPRLHIKPADLVKLVDEEMTKGREVDYTFYFKYKVHHFKVVLVNNKLVYMMDDTYFASVNEIVNRCVVDNNRLFSIYDPISVTDIKYANIPNYTFVGDERFVKYIVYGDNRAYDDQVAPPEY